MALLEPPGEDTLRYTCVAVGGYGVRLRSWTEYGLYGGALLIDIVYAKQFGWSSEPTVNTEIQMEKTRSIAHGLLDAPRVRSGSGLR